MLFKFLLANMRRAREHILPNVRPFISGHNDDDFSRRLASGRARAIHETFRSNIRGKLYGGAPSCPATSLLCLHTHDHVGRAEALGRRHSLLCQRWMKLDKKKRINDSFYAPEWQTEPSCPITGERTTNTTTDHLDTFFPTSKPPPPSCPSINQFSVLRRSN